MKDSVAGYDLPKGELWRHSIAVSVAADVLVKSLQISEADEVFTAALLHDIGKMVLGDYVKEDMPKIDAMVAKGISFEVAEYIVLGTDHAEIGANILKNWSFPTPLVEAVHWHHDPNSCSGHCLMSDIVHTADILGQMAGYGKKCDERDPVPITEVLERLGLELDDLTFLAEQTAERVSAIDEALG
jgi:putative nucleotidyltransferase with HDIG domain